MGVPMFKVQATAMSAIEWMKSKGGTIENMKSDIVWKFSKLGAGGKRRANCERDMHRTLKKFGRVVKAKIQWKQIRMWSHKETMVVCVNFPILLPEDLLLALWECGEHVFRRILFGKLTEQETVAYWNHVEEHCGWFADHPARRWPFRGRLASITTYGDEVNCYKNSECGVVSVCAWSSELAIKADPLLRFFPVAVWSEHEECQDTYNDVISYFVESVRKLSNPAKVWPWTKKHYLVSFTGIQGDLKWLCERMNGFHNYRRNEFCSRCECTKVDATDVQRTLPNFASNHDAHTKRDYSGIDLGQHFSPLLGLPGMCLERVMHDIMHSQYLGTGKVLNGHWG